MGIILEIPTLLLVTPFIFIMCFVWYRLGEKVIEWGIPRYLNWYWRRIGGEGDPPEREG